MGGCKLHVVESAQAFKVDRSGHGGIAPDFFGPKFMIEEEDVRAHLIRVISFSRGVLFLNENRSSREVYKTSTLGDEIAVLKDMGHIRLDAQIGKALAEERLFQPTLRWMYEEKGFRNIVLPGTILRKTADNSLHAMTLSLQDSNEYVASWQVGTRALSAPSDPAYAVPGIHKDNLPCGLRTPLEQ